MAPADSMAACRMASSKYAQGKYDEAMDLLRDMIAKQPRAHCAYFTLGVAFADAGIYRDAIRMWRKVVEIAPDSPEAVSAKESHRRAGEVPQQQVVRPARRGARARPGAAHRPMRRAVVCSPRAPAEEPDVIYLDHNASTPVRPEVAEAMLAALRDLGANPSSTHREGQRARAAVERARDQVAALVNARARRGRVRLGRHRGRSPRDRGRRAGAPRRGPHAWRSRRSSTTRCTARPNVLARPGLRARHAAVRRATGARRRDGVDALPADTTLISVMLANNETGVLQPVAELAARAHARGMLVHCDAVQAAGKVPVDVAALGVDYLVISGAQVRRPQGRGRADRAPRRAARVRCSAAPATSAGGAAAPRTCPGIVGLGLAAELAAARPRPRGRATRRRCASASSAGLREAVPDVVIHGAARAAAAQHRQRLVPRARAATTC